MARIPLMVMSDGISSPTGLGRISRELTQHIHANLSETFEVATLGYGGNYSRNFPWPQYGITKMVNWAINDLPAAWKDFAGDRRGVLLSIYNPSWLPWLADPKKLPKGDLRSMLESNPFERWIYAPLDAEGPNGKLSADVAETLKGFDRVLAYTRWSAEMIDRTILPDGMRVTEDLPHGIDTSVFYARDKAEARKTFIKRVTGAEGNQDIKEDVFLVGIVATNSARKDWGLAFEVCQELLGRGVNVGLWCHTDTLSKHWDILGLAKSFGMEGRVIPSNLVLDDDGMAWAYSACDVTFGIGSGEGFGYPLAESLACGVPVIHGRYAAGKEFVPKEYLVKPVGFYMDGHYANRRPVFDPKEWATVTMRAAGTKVELPAYIDWNSCWPLWEKWLLDGVNGS